MATSKQKIAVVGFWVLCLAGFLAYVQTHQLTYWQALKQSLEFVRTSQYGPLFFLALYTVRPIFLFSAAVLTTAAGALFGPVWGCLYSMLGSHLGAALAYWIGTLLGPKWLETTESATKLGGYLNRMRDKSFETVFLMRLLFLPFDLVNYLAGVLRIHFGAFLLASMLGSIPGTISFVLFGASSGLSGGKPSFDPRVMVASILIFAFSLAISRGLRRWSARDVEEEK